MLNMRDPKTKKIISTIIVVVLVLAEPQNASITRENGQFVITDSVPGRVVDVAGTEAALNEALEGGLDQPIEVTAQVTEEQPAITSEALATIQDVLGTYTTDFSSSGATAGISSR